MLHSSLYSSWFSPSRLISGMLFQTTPEDPSKEDPEPDIEAKRKKAVETLKKHPGLIQYLRENHNPFTTVPNESAKKPEETQAQRAFEGIKTLNIPELIHSLRQEHDKAPHQPLIVSINVNNQSLRNEVEVSQEHSRIPLTDASDFYSYISRYTHRGYHWIQSHKKEFLCYCFIGCFGGINLYLLYLKSFLHQEGTWSRWKNHLTLEELYRIPTTHLTRDIIASLKSSTEQNYYSAPTDTLLKQFIKETMSELTILKRYKNFVSFIRTVPLRNFFIYEGNVLKEISLRIQRVSYLKNAVLSHIEEQQTTIEQPPLVTKN